MLKDGECKFGEECSFYHNEQERRRLIDPLPNLPEGVTLPPMPEKIAPISYFNFFDVYLHCEHMMLNISFNKGSYVLDPFIYIKKRDGVKIVEIGEGAKI